jgi:C4-type Zn-finger protein
LSEEEHHYDGTVLRVCPKCGSADTSSDVRMEGINGELEIVEEYDFCWKCGHEFNRVKTENAKDHDPKS